MRIEFIDSSLQYYLFFVYQLKEFLIDALTQLFHHVPDETQAQIFKRSTVGLSSVFLLRDWLSNYG